MTNLNLPKRNEHGLLGDLKEELDGSLKWSFNLCDTSGCNHGHGPVELVLAQEGEDWVVGVPPREGEEGGMQKFSTHLAAILHFGYVAHSGCDYIERRLTRIDILAQAAALLDNFGINL